MGIIVTNITTSYEINCADALKPPIKAYFEFELHPDKIIQ